MTAENAEKTPVVKALKWDDTTNTKLMQEWEESDRNPAKENILAIAKALVEAFSTTEKPIKVSPKQVVGKLVANKVYEAPEKKPAQKKDESSSKKEIQTILKKPVNMGGADFNTDGFDSATKPALWRLVAHFEENGYEIKGLKYPEGYPEKFA